MALYFIEYDLRKRKDYPELIDELKRLGAIRHLKSAWSLNHDNSSCVLIRDHLIKFIDGDDGLIVALVTDWASFNTDAKPNEP